MRYEQLLFILWTFLTLLLGLFVLDVVCLKLCIVRFRWLFRISNAMVAGAIFKQLYLISNVCCTES